jgi:hypothetical protein
MMLVIAEYVRPVQLGFHGKGVAPSIGLAAYALTPLSGLALRRPAWEAAAPVAPAGVVLTAHRGHIPSALRAAATP